MNARLGWLVYRLRFQWAAGVLAACVCVGSDRLGAQTVRELPDLLILTPTAELPPLVKRREIPCAIESETETEITIYGEVSKGYREEVTFPKSEVLEIRKGASLVSNAFGDVAEMLALPERSQTIGFYTERLNALRGFISEFPDSPEVAQVKEAEIKHQAELERVEKGEIRLRELWYSSGEAQLLRKDIDCLDLIASVTNRVDEMTVRQLDQAAREGGALIVREFESSRFYPELIKTVAAALEGRLAFEKANPGVGAHRALKNVRREIGLVEARIRRILNRPAVGAEFKPRKDNYVQFGSKWYPEGSVDPNTSPYSKYYSTRSSMYLPLSRAAEAEVNELIQKLTDLSRREKETQRAVSTSERDARSELRILESLVTRLRQRSLSNMTDALALTDRADDLFRQGIAKVGEAQRALEQAEALWPSLSAIQLIRRRHTTAAVEQVKQIVAADKVTEAMALLPDVETLVSALNEAGDEVALSLASELEGLHKVIEKRATAERMKELLEEPKKLIMRGEIENAFIQIKAASENVPEDSSSDQRGEFRRTLSEQALEVFKLAQEHDRRDLANSALSLARDLWRENPEISRIIIRTFSKASDLASRGKFEASLDELAFIDDVTDLEDMTRRYRQQLSDEALDRGYAQLRGLNIMGTYQSMDFAREIWEDNPRMSFLNLAAGGVILFGVLMVGGLLMWVYDFWQRRTNPTL